MSVNHHGAFPPADDRGDGPNYPEIAKLLKKFDQQADGTKPREFPRGRIRPDDDGELVYKVGSDPDKGVVMVEFGKSVTWMGLTPQDAMNLAQSLIKHARAIAKEPITIELH